MLEPRSRMLLLDALRPPTNYVFDEGIGTTFTLDLVSLLTAPLAFTMFEAQDPSSPQAASSLEVLQSVRQYAEKLTVFCHATYVSVPKAVLTQYAFLEQTIIECQGPGRGLFHPKVWLLRYVNDLDERRYRLLCLSRNLTFSNSWDTVLSLDGAPTTEGQHRNQGLSEFIGALPGLAVRQPVAESVRTRAEALAEEVKYVEFALPDGFTALRFWPMIGSSATWPFEGSSDRLLVVSPFVTADCLERLASTTNDAILISTRDDLAKLDHRPGGFSRFHTLHDRAVAEFLDSEATGVQGTQRELAVLTGLHAKCYVAERGDDTHVWTGSANATAAAFGLNVEFLTELVGPTREFGIDRTLRHEGDDLTFGCLLTDATDSVATRTPEPDEDALRFDLERVRAILAEAQLNAYVEDAGQARWTITLRGEFAESTPNDIVVWCWPMLVAGRRQMFDLRQGQVELTFGDLAFEAIAAFFACEVTAQRGKCRESCQFVVKAELVGAPADRHDRLLQALVRDRAVLMRFLYLLLADDAHGLLDVDDASNTSANQKWEWSSVSQAGLFELLVGALERRPERLRDVARLVTPTQGIENVDLPPGFSEIWKPVWAAATEDGRVQDS